MAARRAADDAGWEKFVAARQRRAGQLAVAEVPCSFNPHGESLLQLYANTTAVAEVPWPSGPWPANILWLQPGARGPGLQFGTPAAPKR